MTDSAAITGLCQHDIAAQLLALMNVMRLERKFDLPATPVRLVGGGESETGPAAFFDSDFASGRFSASGDTDDLSGYDDLAAMASTIDETQMARMLAQDAGFVIDQPTGILTFMGEDRESVASDVAAIGAELPFLPKIITALRQAQRRITEWGGDDIGQAACLFLDRGATLPDEIYLLWAARQPGAVLVFSDRPGAAEHLARADGGIIPADTLWHRSDLSAPLQRLLDILLMARCARIGGAADSLAAHAAAAFGQRRFCRLADILPDDLRAQASTLLLDRVIDSPDSFLDSEDLVRSAEYAATFAVGAGQGGRLAEALCDRPAHRPMLRHVIATCALAVGDQTRAATEARRGLAEIVLRPSARSQCQQVLDVMAGEADPDMPAAQDAFLMALFTEPLRDTPARDRLALLHLGQPGAVATALMVRPGSLGPAGDAGSPPTWTYLADWQELLADDTARQPLLDQPALFKKLGLAGPDLPDLEAALKDGRRPEPAASRDAAGLAALALSLHGRYARALRLLHWLEVCDPDDPLMHKRLSDTMFRLDRIEDGFDHLDRALRLQPDNPLLHLSVARRAADLGFAAQALDAIERADAIWPGRPLVAWQAGRVRASLAGDPVRVAAR